jgi:hypothetical protein
MPDRGARAERLRKALLRHFVEEGYLCERGRAAGRAPPASVPRVPCTHPPAPRPARRAAPPARAAPLSPPPPPPVTLPPLPAPQGTGCWRSP